MSISRRNALASVCAVLATAGLLHAAAWADQGSTAGGSLESRLVALASADPDLPQASPIVALVGKPANAGAGRQLVSFTLHYAGLSNRYCRLAVAEPSSGALRIVALPSAALHDQCKSLSPVLVADVDGDGTPDVVHGVRIASNAGRFDVQEALVYLSKKEATAGYCHSAAASATLAPADLASTARVRAALQQAVRRLGASVLECSGS
jgi:hypothetical protein